MNNDRYYIMNIYYMLDTMANPLYILIHLFLTGWDTKITPILQMMIARVQEISDSLMAEEGAVLPTQQLFCHL